MYCPQCSAHNSQKQKYCRQCGLGLTDVRFALEGKANETITKYRKGGELFVTGLIILGICILNVLINQIMSSEARNLATSAILILGLVISLPIIITGLVRISLADRLLKLKQEQQSDPLPGSATEWSEPQLQQAPVTDPLMSQLSSRGSVTEGTTFKLRRSDQPQ